MKKASLIWIDLEMTGLDPLKHRIIEVAAILTDWDFTEIASYHAIVKQPTKVIEEMEAWPKAQHAKTGLIEQIPDGKNEKVVEREIIDLIEKHCLKPVILAGNSVHFDRRFIIKYWPKLESMLHYRILDVSSWKVLMMSKFKVRFSKPETHRAMDDIRGSIEEIKYYLNKANFIKK